MVKTDGCSVRKEGRDWNMPDEQVILRNHLES